MKNRTITNPINGDKVTFLKTCEETKGESLLAELEVFPNAQGTSAAPPHYHVSYTESFHVLEGELTVRIGKKTLVLGKGQSATVPLRTVHTFSNKTSQTVKALVETRPGLQGFEDGLIIMYGLASDGKTTKKGMPKSILHLALLMVMGDIRFAGIMSVLNPFMRLFAEIARKRGIKQILVDGYCK
jgi:mannose-6-phosphate isomerase-like protein (cupin superfamily)